MNSNKIESILKSTRPKKTALDPQAYIGGGQSKLSYSGHRMPQLRKLYMTEFQWPGVSLQKQAQIWTDVFMKSEVFEVMLFSLFWAESLSNEELIKCWPKLKTWSRRIDNWAHSDSLCGIYSKILEAKPAIILPTLEKWNQSKNPWLVRISMVSLFYYARARKKFPSQKVVEKFLSSHWAHEHYYVQKAIGWTLRESITASPENGFQFFKKNVLRVSGIAFSAAAERLDQNEKMNLKQARKSSRPRS